MTDKTLQQCADNIVRNLSTPCEVSKMLKSWHTDSVVHTMFVDLHTGSSCSFEDFEVKSSKDYRHLHLLVKQRLIHAVLDMRDLADDTLEKLGYDLCHEQQKPTDSTGLLTWLAMSIKRLHDRCHGLTDR